MRLDRRAVGGVVLRPRRQAAASPSPFKWTYHFCFGVAQFADAYTHLWPQVPTNKKVGVMWPNDADGNAIRGALGPLLKKAGYTIVDPGAYPDGTNDYSSQIAQFKQKNCEIFNTFPIPPDFATFWRQAAQQGYTKREDRPDRQDRAVPLAGRGARHARRQPRERRVLGADVAVHVVADRDHLEGARGRLREGERQAVEPAGSARAWRCSTSPTAALKASGNPKDKAGGRQRDEDAHGRRRRSARSQWGKGPGRQRRRDADHRRPVGQGAKGSVPARLRALRELDDPNVPIAGKLIPYSLDPCSRSERR